MNQMASTAEETGIPWRSAYLKMTLLEAMCFSANAISFGCWSLVIRIFAFRVENKPIGRGWDSSHARIVYARVFF